jgi:pyruvate dehydrogenase E1 component beta subunit
MAIPGLKVVAPATPADMKGLLAAAVRDDDPVIVCEHKALFAEKGDVPDGEHVVPLGQAAVVREGSDVTLVALAAMVPRAVAAAERLAADHGIDAEVIDLRSLIPLDAKAVLTSVAKTSRLFTVEENPRVGGWGAEIVSLVADEGFYSLDAPLVRITTPHIPLPSAATLEDLALPSVDRIVETVSRRLAEAR